MSRSEVIGAVGGAAVFGVSWWEARRREVSSPEAVVMGAVNEQPEHLFWPLSMAMQLGSLGGGLAVGGIIAWRGERVGGVTVAAAAMSAWLTAKVVKHQTGRGRPADHLEGVVIRGRRQGGLGFPSGHAGVAAASAVAARGAVPQPVAALLALGALATGAARVYVGAHLPLDVVGGVGMGVALGSVARVVAQAISGQ